jgi:DNA polymerase elongation subunit (family B)
MKYNYFFPQLKRDCLIVDIETWAEFANGQEINISYQFENYVDCAQIKWFGAYSYARNAFYILEAKKNKGFIINLLNTHNTIIGFNSQEFDYPILKNNGYIINEKKRPVHIDCMQILGKSVFSNRDGYAYKNRGELMDYKFKNNSLK